MEIDGHPTQDLVDELIRRGGLRAEGTASGPRVESLRFIAERLDDASGFWLFLPFETFDTGLDEIPG
ncbi:MAG: hypothetical protein M3290_08975 [Actinomycetota bacterium]|nr:hypothetical protein [Actinomycetota bacterium]